SVRLPGDQIDRSGRGWTEVRGEVVIADGKVLRVVPQRGDRIAVEIPHDIAGCTGGRAAARSGSRSRFLHHLVDEAMVVSFLLCFVLMVLIARGRVRSREAKRGLVVRILSEQRAAQAVDVWRARPGVETRLARRVLGMRISSEVVIERDVLLIDHDHMLDRRCRLILRKCMWQESAEQSQKTQGYEPPATGCYAGIIDVPHDKRSPR